MLVLIAAVSLSIAIAVYLVNKKRNFLSPNSQVPTDIQTEEVVFEDYPEDQPPAQMEEKKQDINFLESNFEIEQLYSEEAEQPKTEIEAPVQEEEPVEVKKKKVKPSAKKGKPAKKEAKTKGAKRGRKPKPKDDILLHS